MVGKYFLPLNSQRLSIICSVAVFAICPVTYLASAQKHHPSTATARLALAEDVPLNNATVSFGGWMTTPPLDRFPNVSDRFANHHALAPEVAKIKAGGMSLIQAPIW